MKRGAVVDSRHAFANSTALHFAAEDGHHEIIEALCDAGADADASTTLGGRPLHAAAQKGHERAVAALLKCGASPEALLNNDTTPLYLAALEGHAAAARALVQGGASLNPTIQRRAGSASRAAAADAAAEGIDIGAAHQYTDNAACVALLDGRGPPAAATRSSGPHSPRKSANGMDALASLTADMGLGSNPTQSAPMGGSLI